MPDGDLQENSNKPSSAIAGAIFGGLFNTAPTNNKDLPSAPSGRPNYNQIKAPTAHGASPAAGLDSLQRLQDGNKFENEAFDPQEVAQQAIAQTRYNIKGRPKSPNTPGHYCAAYVRKSFQAAGVNMDGHPHLAGQYASQGFLANKGFVSVGNGQGNDFFEQNPDYKPQVGDVAVMQRAKQAGHISVYTGEKGWVSDFMQRDMQGGPSYRTAACKVTVFRHKSLMDKNAPSASLEASKTHDNDAMLRRSATLGM